MPAFGGWEAEVFDYWFETLEPSAWFRASDAVDEEIRQRFEAHLAAQAAEPSAAIGLHDQQTLARVILFDQFPRNLYRGSADAFAYDERARQHTRLAIAAAQDVTLPPVQRGFLYMPLMHSENVSDQRDAERLFAQSGLESFYPSAQEHRAIVEQFGRFPHRNAALGRDSTEDERAWLETGKRFGQ